MDRALTASIAAFLLLGLPGPALGALCEVPDAGGTAALPPDGCEYIATGVPIVIVDGLPPGTTIELEPIYKDFLCNVGPGGLCSVPIAPGLCEVPGGTLGGDLDCSNNTLALQVTGTGLLAGFNRTLNLSSFGEVHTGPRTPGDPVQAFDSELVNLQADLFGDPDFDVLQIRAGATWALPSPGHTTLTQKTNGNWQVDSFFDVAYQISFQGAPGSVLEGLAGTTTADFQMATGTNPCDVPDDGNGTVELPPQGCDYITPDDPFRIVDGLPPGTTIELDAIHRNFFCNSPITCTAAIPSGVCEVAGGSLGGNTECFQSELRLAITGTGALAFFNRTITMPMDAEAHTASRVPGDPLQSFSNTMFRLQGEIFGDPDFCTFRIRAGDQLGLPSPGLKQLSDNGDGTFEVDSFFDITYEIDFQGCPGSALEGFGGTSNGALRLETGDPVSTTPVPGLTGGWLWLLGALLALSSAWLLVRGRVTS